MIEQIALISIGVILQSASFLLGWFAGRSMVKTGNDNAEKSPKSPSYWHGVRKYD